MERISNLSTLACGAGGELVKMNRFKHWTEQSDDWIHAHPWHIAAITGALNALFITVLYSSNNPYPWFPAPERGIIAGVLWFLIWGCLVSRLGPRA
jgi:hypothetical protein